MVISLDKIVHLARFRRLMYIEYTALDQTHELNDFSQALRFNKEVRLCPDREN